MRFDERFANMTYRKNFAVKYMSTIRAQIKDFIRQELESSLSSYRTRVKELIKKEAMLINNQGIIELDIGEIVQLDKVLDLLDRDKEI